jgi:hypothetical protein
MHNNSCIVLSWLRVNSFIVSFWVRVNSTKKFDRLVMTPKLLSILLSISFVVTLFSMTEKLSLSSVIFVKKLGE